MARQGSHLQNSRPSLRLGLVFGVLVWACGLNQALCLAAESSPKIAIVLAPYRVYEETCQTLHKTLSAEGIDNKVFTLPKGYGQDQDQEEDEQNGDSPKGAPPPETAPQQGPDPLDVIRQYQPDLIVSAGASVTALLAEYYTETPIVFIMVPNGLDMLKKMQAAPKHPPFAGVTTDPSPKEQIKWIKQLDPNSRRIGVLHSGRSEKTVGALIAAAREEGVTVIGIKAQRSQFAKAIAKLHEQHCDSVLMIADAGVYNAANVRALLLWGLRNKKPVWAFSANIVKAGATAGLYANYQQVAQDAVSLLKKIAKGADVRKIELIYPDRLESAINERSAQMIGLDPPAQVLRQIDIHFGKEK